MVIGSVKRTIHLSVSALVLAGAPGCITFIQTRYSVFGFDGLQTASAEQARAWSILLLGAVAVVSAGLGVIGLWLGRRWYVRRQDKTVVVSASANLNSDDGAPTTAHSTGRGEEWNGQLGGLRGGRETGSEVDCSPRQM